MTAPTIQDLFDFTPNFEAAIRARLTAAGIDSIAPRSSDTVDRDRVTFSFSVGSATSDTMQYAGGSEYYRYVGCEVVVRLQWPRGEVADADRMATIAQTRAAFRQSQKPLTREALKYYAVTRIQPAGESIGIDAAETCDLAELRWQVDFQILRSAWPVVS